MNKWINKVEQDTKTRIKEKGRQNNIEEKDVEEKGEQVRERERKEVKEKETN